MKFKVGDRAKMTETTGDYDFSDCYITGYVTIAEVTPRYYECLVEGCDDDAPLCFYEYELLPIEEEEEKEKEFPKYKVGDVVKMNDKHPYCFDYWDVDGTMTIKEVKPWGIYYCDVHKYPGGCLNFPPEWIEGYAEEDVKPGDIVRIKGDIRDSTDLLDGKHGIVTEVDGDDCKVAVYSPIAKKIKYWKIWKNNMTKC